MRLDSNIESKSSYNTYIIDLSSNQNQKPFEKEFATLAARAVFVSLFFFFFQKQ